MADDMTPNFSRHAINTLGVMFVYGLYVETLEITERRHQIAQVEDQLPRPPNAVMLKSDMLFMNIITICPVLAMKKADIIIGETLSATLPVVQFSAINFYSIYTGEVHIELRHE